VSEQRFEIIEVLEAEARIVGLRGEFDLSSVPRAQPVLEAASSDRERVLVIDLTACTFIDSSGLAALVGAARALTNGQIRISIACEEDSAVMSVLELAGIDRTIPILPTVKAALKAALAND